MPQFTRRELATRLVVAGFAVALGDDTSSATGIGARMAGRAAATGHIHALGLDPRLFPDYDSRKGQDFSVLTSLNLASGELRQYTDALGGVLSPVVLSKEGAAPRLAFVDYYKGNSSLHTFDLKEPLHTAASADFGAPGPIVDFQAPLQHTLVAENTRVREFNKDGKVVGETRATWAVEANRYYAR